MWQDTDVLLLLTSPHPYSAYRIRKNTLSRPSFLLQCEFIDFFFILMDCKLLF